MNTSFGLGNCGSGGNTPMTRCTRSVIPIVSPTMLESAPMRVRQNSWLSTTTGAAPGWSSPARKVRPSSARTPSTSKKWADTTPVCTRCGSPRPIMLNDMEWYSTRCSNCRDCAR